MHDSHSHPRNHIRRVTIIRRGRASLSAGLFFWIHSAEVEHKGNQLHKMPASSNLDTTLPLPFSAT